MASAAASSGLISHILLANLQSIPASLHSLQIPYLDAAVSFIGHDKPFLLVLLHQKIWDTSLVSVTTESLLQSGPDDMKSACLLAVSTKESGAWLLKFSHFQL